ncbi:hypothetical protein KY321_05635 [Candidatus Woesearchaeota archaeon]|nr:hypothetical protein [Candidatus Woesearchaeota archaeon]
MEAPISQIGEKLSASDIGERVARLLSEKRSEVGNFNSGTDYSNPFLQEIIRKVENSFCYNINIYQDTTSEEDFHCIIDDSMETGSFYILHQIAGDESKKVGFDNCNEKAMSAIMVCKDFDYEEVKIRTCTGFVEDKEHFLDESKPRTYSFFCEVLFSYDNSIKTPYKLVLKGDIPYQGSMAAKSAKFLDELERKINNAIESLHDRGLLLK